MATKMVNFRLSEGEVAKLDEIAQIAGMNRSDYIKSCLSQVLNGSGTIVPPKAKPTKTQCPAGNSVGCQQAQWGRLPTGVKVCMTNGCGVRKA